MSPRLKSINSFLLRIEENGVRWADFLYSLLNFFLLNRKIIAITLIRYMRPEFHGKAIKSDAIHGDRDQSDREAALGGFKEGDISILIATDVASRGLDVRGVTHVINYDFPRDMEDYVHRVGRTGRAGREGTAVSYFTREDWKKSTELIKILEDSNQVVPDELRVMSERWEKKRVQIEREGRRGGGRGGGGGRQRYR